MQVKHAVLLSATEAAEMILRVDEIIKGEYMQVDQANPMVKDCIDWIAECCSTSNLCPAFCCSGATAT